MTTTQSNHREIKLKQKKCKIRRLALRLCLGQGNWKSRLGKVGIVETKKCWATGSELVVITSNRGKDDEKHKTEQALNKT